MVPRVKIAVKSRRRLSSADDLWIVCGRLEMIQPQWLHLGNVNVKSTKYITEA